MTIWGVFFAKSYFLYVELEKFFFQIFNFFLFKEKNHPTSMRATARYIASIFKIWVWNIISMLRRVRSTCGRTPYVHTEGTEIWNIRHKFLKFLCLLCATCVPGVCATWVRIPGGAHDKIISPNAVPTQCPDFSNSSPLSLWFTGRFCKNGRIGG